MPTTYTFTKQDLQASITAAAGANAGVTTSMLYSFMGIESSGGNANIQDSKTGAVGIAQIEPGTWQQFFPGLPEPDDPNLQIAAMGKILGSYASAYNGDPGLMAVAYNAGPGVANLAQKYLANGTASDTATAIQMATANYVGKGNNGSYTISAANQREIQNYANTIVKGSISQATQAPDSSTGSSGAGGGSGPGIVSGASVADENAVVASGLSDYIINAGAISAVLSAIAPTSLVISQGLDETPWFNNRDIVQVNGATAAVDAPIKFQVYFDDPNQPMSPVIELNASVSRFDRGMRHIRNSQQTRTGILVTLWGLEPDMITGSGSTGLFMNEFGVTDFLSLSDTSSPEIQRLMTEGFQQLKKTTAPNTPAAPTPDPRLVVPPSPNPLANHHLRAQDQGPYTSPDSMRIAAKDAFMELLALFRQNGMVWFQGSTGGSSVDVNQFAPNAWSSQFGLSLAQMNARRNDVAARGGVIMTFRNAKYYGYFTNLSWDEDATKPFSWNFNFAFKVERTSKQVFSPSHSLTPIQKARLASGKTLDQSSVTDVVTVQRGVVGTVVGTLNI